MSVPDPTKPTPEEVDAVASAAKDRIESIGLDKFVDALKAAGAEVEVTGPLECPKCESKEQTVLDSPPRMQCLTCKHEWVPSFP